MSTIYIDRVSFADSMEQFEMDDEIKESDNPLYSSRSDYQWEWSAIDFISMACPILENLQFRLD